MLNKENGSIYFRVMLCVAIVMVVMFSLKLCSSAWSDTKKDLVTQGQTQQANQQLQQDLKDAETQVEVKEKVDAIQDSTVIEVRKEEVKTQKTVRERIEKVEAKVTNIKSDPVLTEKEKDLEIATAQIDSLWDAYCATMGSDCKI